MALEHREFSEQLDISSNNAREQLSALMKMIESSSTFQTTQADRLKNLYGKFNTLSASEQTSIGNSIANTSKMAIGTDVAARSKSQREFTAVAQGNYDRQSAARDLETDFAFV
ncbi:MAG: hypothetical protein ACOYN2_04255 [Patescibacteria group bacterium]